jgi:hypothetical protein
MDRLLAMAFCSFLLNFESRHWNWKKRDLIEVSPAFTGLLQSTSRLLELVEIPAKPDT